MKNKFLIKNNNTNKNNHILFLLKPFILNLYKSILTNFKYIVKNLYNFKKIK